MLYFRLKLHVFINSLLSDDLGEEFVAGKLQL